MGYNTEFDGRIELDKELDNETYELLTNLADTRRMKRNISKIAAKLEIDVSEATKKYGPEGEFYFVDDGDLGQTEDETVVEYNNPPDSQPGLWLNWIPTEDRFGIEWNGAEKFYNSVEWMKYIVKEILEPRGYVANGIIDAQGEDHDDRWRLAVRDNKVYVARFENTIKEIEYHN